jgi:hypothetical protein
MTEQLDIVERLRAALKECADDLEAEIRDRYKLTMDVYPSEKRKFDRDMASVIAARKLLGETE